MMNAPVFRKVLVANRGEIAVRVIGALREMGIPSVAVFSEADRHALHVRLADEAYNVGPASSRESYLNQDRIIETARRAGAAAIHPGYGFLSENASFARRCADSGITFIGPPASVINLMGNKVAARATAQKAGAPVVPGSDGPVKNEPHALETAGRLGYPVMLKAAAGGGGKGMRVVRSDGELRSSLALTRGEAKAAFGDDEIYLEKLIQNPRHIEIQVLFDGHGRGVHLGERECSIQRRHQKVIEEAPSPVISPEQRDAMGRAALAIAGAAGYANAGTVEFLYAPDGSFYFLEMNTRLQVEHPVTELVYNVDIVYEQINIAAGRPLELSQPQITPRGWAIECRVYAEDPYNGFLPSQGRILRLRLPSGAGVRNDVGIFEGYDVPLHYDPLLAKLIVYGRDRNEARLRMLRAFDEYRIDGIQTTIPFHRWLLAQEDFARGELDTGTIERRFAGLKPDGGGEDELVAVIGAVLYAHEHRSSITPASVSARAPSAWKRSERTRRWPR